MTVAQYKEQTNQFDSTMEEAYVLRGAYFILHKTANMLEAQASSKTDRHGRPMTPARKKELMAEAAKVRNTARELNN